MPGVPGIGPAIAVDLLKRFGTLDACLAQARIIPGQPGRHPTGHAELLYWRPAQSPPRADVPAGRLLTSRRPRIDQGNHAGEVRLVARDDLQLMMQRGCGDQRIAL